jgi:hypothetical protein
MSADNHHYECEVDGWRWVYEIDGDKLIADGKNGVEFQHFEFELKHCSDVTDRGAKAQSVHFPPRAWLVWGVILAATGILVAGVFIMISVLRIPWTQTVRSVVVGGIVVFVVLEVIIGPFVLSKLLYQRKVQRYVTFKRLSDGAGQFTLHSSFNEDDHAFEDFVNELFAVIQRQRTTQTPPDYSFKQ